MAQPIVPSALEFMDGHALGLVRARGVDPGPGGALLIVEADGLADSIDSALAALEAAARGEGCLAVHRAGDAQRRNALWSARRALSPALKELASGKINEDVVVPVSKIPALCARVDDLAARSGLAIVVFGHAGNGNLHVNLMFEASDAAQAERAHAATAELFAAVIELGGTLSGEHGIGLAKRDYMRAATDPVTLDLMAATKHVFDPHNILNPGKLLPESLA